MDMTTPVTGAALEPLRSFVAALPKVELHVHLEGSVQPATLLRLARKYNSSQLPSTLQGFRSFYRFTDFDHFVTVYYTICDHLREDEDFALVAQQTAEHLARQGVRWAEVTFTPYNHLRRGVSAATMFAGIEAGRRAAEASTGIRVRWSLDVPGEFGPDAAAATLDAYEEVRPEGVVSFGLGGPEVPRPAFARAFARALDLGLHSVPHAGENAGPESIWDSLRTLGAERIGHGVRCLEDPRLVEHLRATATPLEVCPTSNASLGVVDSLDVHPLPRLLDEGLVVTLNSDDPAMFDTTLEQEYLLALTTLGLSPPQVATMAANAVRSSFMPDRDKVALLGEVADVPVPAID